MVAGTGIEPVSVELMRPRKVVRSTPRNKLVGKQGLEPWFSRTRNARLCH